MVLGEFLYLYVKSKQLEWLKAENVGGLCKWFYEIMWEGFFFSFSPHHKGNLNQKHFFRNSPDVRTSRRQPKIGSFAVFHALLNFLFPNDKNENSAVAERQKCSF